MAFYLDCLKLACEMSHIQAWQELLRKHHLYYILFIFYLIHILPVILLLKCPARPLPEPPAGTPCPVGASRVVRASRQDTETLLQSWSEGHVSVPGRVCCIDTL